MAEKPNWPEITRAVMGLICTLLGVSLTVSSSVEEVRSPGLGRFPSRRVVSSPATLALAATRGSVVSTPACENLVFVRTFAATTSVKTLIGTISVILVMAISGFSKSQSVEDRHFDWRARPPERRSGDDIYSAVDFRLALKADLPNRSARQLQQLLWPEPGRS